jgi:hypothetical protein
MVYILLATVMMLGMAAIAVDMAMIYAARRRAQTVADAAALAAGPLLPNSALSTIAAQSVATANNSGAPAFNIISLAYASGSNTNITLDDGTSMALAGGAAITVTGYVDAPLSFAPVIGYRPKSKTNKANTLSVLASATIIVRSACGLPGGMGMGPFGLVADDPNSNNADVAYIATLLTTAQNSQTPMPNTYQPVDKQLPLKVSRWQNGTIQTGGNFGALDLGGSGANSYSDDIMIPSSQTFSVGQEIPTKTGNMVGPTRDGVLGRLDSNNPHFTHNYTNYIDWFFGDQTLAVDTSLPSVTENGQTYYYRKDPHRQELTDARVMVLPLISQPSKNGRAGAVILAFAAFFIETVNDNDITGRFIGIMMPNGGSGTCTGGGTYQWPRLVR